MVYGSVLSVMKRKERGGYIIPKKIIEVDRLTWLKMIEVFGQKEVNNMEIVPSLEEQLNKLRRINAKIKKENKKRD